MHSQSAHLCNFISALTHGAGRKLMEYLSNSTAAEARLLAERFSCSACRTPRYIYLASFGLVGGGLLLVASRSTQRRPFHWESKERLN